MCTQNLHKMCLRASLNAQYQRTKEMICTNFYGLLKLMKMAFFESDNELIHSVSSKNVSFHSIEYVFSLHSRFLSQKMPHNVSTCNIKNYAVSPLYDSHSRYESIHPDRLTKNVNKYFMLHDFDPWDMSLIVRNLILVQISGENSKEVYTEFKLLTSNQRKRLFSFGNFSNQARVHFQLQQSDSVIFDEICLRANSFSLQMCSCVMQSYRR